MARPKTFRTTMSARAIGGQGVLPLLAARLSPQGREIVWAGLCRTSGPYFSGEWRHSVSGVGDVRLAIVARGWSAALLLVSCVLVLFRPQSGSGASPLFRAGFVILGAVLGTSITWAFLKSR